MKMTRARLDQDKVKAFPFCGAQNPIKSYHLYYDKCHLTVPQRLLCELGAGKGWMVAICPNVSG